MIPNQHLAFQGIPSWRDTERTHGFGAGHDFQDSESESECLARLNSRVLDVFNSSLSYLGQGAGK